MHTSTRHIRQQRSAFSLIEVTMAIGLVAFALVGIIGAMGTGSTALGRAVDATVNAQITQNILGSVRQSGFSVVTAQSADGGWEGRTYYFDERGVSLTSATNAVYTAITNVQSPVSLPCDPSLHNEKLANVTITISKNAIKTGTISIIVANNGQ